MQPDSEFRQRLREQLIDHKNNGTLGVVAARAGIFEFVLRDWCNDAAKVPNSEELMRANDAVSVRPARLPSSEDAAVGAGQDGCFVTSPKRVTD
jgi:hypothetical protein